MNILSSRELFGKNRGWIIIHALSAILLFGALAYQYVLDMHPCYLCIQQRALVLAVYLTSLIGYLLLLNKPENTSWGFKLADFILVVLTAIAAAYAYDISGSHVAMASAGEFGFMFSTCEGGSPFPNFMPLDIWWPEVLGVKASCDGEVAKALGVEMPVYVQAFSVLVIMVCCAKLVLALDTKE